MKRHILLSGLLILCFISLTFAQVQRHDYQKIDYIHVDQSEMERFTKLAKDILKPAFTELADSEEIKSWRLYKVGYPGGVRSEYSYISITTVGNPGAIEKIFSDQNLPYYIPGDIRNSKKLLNNATSLIASELWKVENTVEIDSLPERPSKYLVMDYMEVPTGRDLDYLMLEDEIAKPIHSERIDGEKMAGWETYSLISPGGTNYGYNFSTGNHFDSLTHVEFGFTEEVINRALADANIPELFDTIYSTRRLVKSELWELIDYAR